MVALNLTHVRVCLGLAVGLTAVSYWLFWYSNLSARPMFLARWLGQNPDPDSLCLMELLDAFGVKAVNASEPIYVRLSKPVALVNGTACQRLLVPAVSAPAGFKKLENLNSKQQEKIHTIVYNLLANFTQRKLELFLAGGSLLGSVRHFGFFPWDADADLMVPSSQKAQSRQLLIELSASDELRFVDTERLNGHWQLGIFCQAERGKPLTRMYGTEKLYPSKACATIVDFFFGYTEKKLYRRAEYPHSFPIEHVYPLTLRPYGPYLIPGPRDTDKFLTAVYGKDYETQCQFKYFHHQHYRCADLRSVYPFVTHLQLRHRNRSLQVDVLLQNFSLHGLFIPWRL